MSFFGMIVKSLGYRTDLIFPAFDGEVLDRGDYLVVRSPSNPTFYWGNFLLFSQPPQTGDFIRWRALFAKEIGELPKVEHQVFGWDSPGGETGICQPFLQAGFRLSRGPVLVGDAIQPPVNRSNFIEVRPLQAQTDWAQAVENQVICREAEFEEEGYRDFRRLQMSRYRRMVAAGLGNWYGAFIDERLVADLGIFYDGQVGRYQSVQTHPKYRRQGIAGTLVYEAGRLAMATFNLDTLVIVADTGSAAERLYRSLGFQESEVQVGLERWPGIDVDLTQKN